jgi:hypothetical protein
MDEAAFKLLLCNTRTAISLEIGYDLALLKIAFQGVYDD